MTHFGGAALRVLRTVNRPLPLCKRPFEALAQESGLAESDILDRLNAWLEDGTIRRFGARVNHRALGFTDNGMAVWRVPREAVEETAACLAAQPEVTHCYQRRTQPGWDYNLYAMVHGRSVHEVLTIVDRIAEMTGQYDYDVLFSLREFKKSAPRFFENNKSEEGRTE